MTGWLEALPEPMDLRLVGPRIELSRWQNFMPIAVLCGISILSSLPWLLVQWEYTAGTGRRTSRAAGGPRHQQKHT